MIKRFNVLGSMKEVPKIEFNCGTVYIRSNIIRIDEEEGNEPFHGWQYDEQEMNETEYLDILNEGVDKLNEEDINNKLALAEIYELIIGGGD